MNTVEQLQGSIQVLTSELGKVLNEGIPQIQDGVSEVRGDIKDLKNAVINQESSMSQIVSK